MARRRGLSIALQTALGALSGAAGGYAQQEEMKRKRMAEDTEFLLKYGDRFVEPGPLATRVPTGAPTPEAPKVAPPPSAIPMPTGPVDFGAATRQLEQEEARPSGTVAREVLGQTRFIPIGQRARDIARSQQIQEEEDAVQRAIRIAREQGKVQRESAEEVFQVTNQRDFQLAQRLGLTKKGEKYDPKTTYGDVIEIETRKRGGAPGPNMVNIRLTAVKNLTEELGRKPTDTEVDEYVSLIVPQAAAAPTGGSRLSQGIAFARRLRDQGVSRDEAAKQVRSQFPDVADQLLGTSAAPSPAPVTMPAQAGGLFRANMLTSPVGAAQPGNMDEIRSLAARLAELNKGKRGSIAAREQYQRNATERARVQAALAEAQRRYSASR